MLYGKTGYTGPWTTWVFETNYWYSMNHAPGAGSIARDVDLQSGVLPINALRLLLNIIH